MSERGLDPQLRRFIYEMNGKEDREPMLKTKAEREKFQRHLEKVNAEILKRVEDRKKARLEQK